MARSTTTPGALPLHAGYDPNLAGIEHTASLLTRLLTQNGVRSPATGATFTEADVLGLAGGIGFMVFLFDYEGSLPMITIITRSHPATMSTVLSDRLGLDYTHQLTTSAKQASSTLDGYLDQGRSVFLGAAGDIVVAGGAASADTLTIDRGRTGLETWTRSRLDETRAADKKMKHELLAINDPTITADFSAVLESAVAQTAANLDQPVLGNAFDANFGLRGMAKFSSVLTDTRTKKGWPALLADPAAFVFGMERIFGGLTYEYGGPKALRPLYVSFLRRAADANGQDRASWREAADRFDDAGRCWQAAADAALPADGHPALVAVRVALLDHSAHRSTAPSFPIEPLEESRARFVREPLDEKARRQAMAEIASHVDEARAAEQAAVTLIRA